MLKSEYRQEVLDMIRQSYQPIRVPKSYYDEVMELERIRQIRIVAVEPLFYLCEATK